VNAAERHARLSELFGELMDCAEAQRERELRELKGVEPELAAELAELLHIHAHSHATLDFCPTSDEASDTDPNCGRRLGVWRLDGLLGEGGMGRVYAAHRVDGGFEQQAAVKLIRNRQANSEQGVRFRRERQLLARLEHPGIARLIDGGESADGELYLVMERVDGQPIDQYCNASGLGLGARLKLLTEICAAVSWAHLHLIVHRDIKPDNVLVDVQGRVRLVDFGIADLLAASTDSAARAHVDGLMPLTPAFAAPELRSGAAITTLTDLYAIGVLSWLLLSGSQRRQLPAPGSESPRLWPPLDSAARCAGRHDLARHLNVDFDAVLSKAVAEQPESRYGSVVEFADDLQRAWSGEPVIARGNSRRYRLRCFLGRHRYAAVAVLLAACGLLATTVWALISAHRADLESARADRSLARSEQVNQFLWSVLLAPDPASRLLGWTAGRELTVADLLEGLEARVDQAFIDDPVAAVNTQLALAQSHLASGRRERGQKLLEAMRERAAALDPAVYPEAYELRAISLHMLGRLAQQQGDAIAASLLRQALADYQQAGAALTPLRRLSAVAALHDLGRVSLAEDRAAGEALIRRAISLAGNELPHGNPVLPISLRVLAQLRLEDGDAAEAAQLAASSLQQQDPQTTPAEMRADTWLILAEARKALRRADADEALAEAGSALATLPADDSAAKPLRARMQRLIESDQAR
jgi:eukaryotic-like serine/threonine-protein kinase